MRFTTGQTEYEVTHIEELGEDLKNMRSKLIKHDKEPRIYYAGKVLKNGRVSEKQGGMFYRFNSGSFLKVF